MRYFVRALHIIFSVYSLLMFIAGLLIVFPFVVVASFWGKHKGGNIIYILCKAWARIGLILWGISHRNIYEQPIDTSKQYVFVFNHISYMDIPILLVALRKINIRVLGKAEMKKIPIFGFVYKNAAVTVERDNAIDRAKSVTVLKSVIKKGISIVLSPEGTFNMTHRPLKNFYDGAFKIAIETQTPIKPILFLDTYDRMRYETIFSVNPGKSRAVFLDEVSVEGLTLADVSTLRDKVYQIMEQKLIAYKASWIK